MKSNNRLKEKKKEKKTNKQTNKIVSSFVIESCYFMVAKKIIMRHYGTWQALYSEVRKVCQSQDFYFKRPEQSDSFYGSFKPFIVCKGEKLIF